MNNTTLAQPNACGTRMEKAYRHIRDQLSAGQLPSGSRLSNRRIAKEVGISFTPVREALRRLVSEGLLEYREGLGVFVPNLSTQTIRENHEISEILEAAAAARVASDPPPDMLARMTRTQETMAQLFAEISGNTAEKEIQLNPEATWQALDNTFHFAVLCATGNRKLADMAMSLRTSHNTMLTGLLEAFHLEESKVQNHLRRTLDDHDHILKAFKTNDPTTIENTVRQHLHTELEFVLASYKYRYMNHRVTTIV